MRRLIPLFLTALITAFAAAPASADAAKRAQCLLRKSGPSCYLWTGKVTFVADGDTVYVDIDGDGSRKRFPVRITGCLLYTSPSPRDGLLSRMPSSA